MACRTWRVSPSRPLDSRALTTVGFLSQRKVFIIERAAVFTIACLVFGAVVSLLAGPFAAVSRLGGWQSLAKDMLIKFISEDASYINYPLTAKHYALPFFLMQFPSKTEQTRDSGLADKYKICATVYCGDVVNVQPRFNFSDEIIK